MTRAHACAAGAVGSSAEKEALGCSKGGFSCKIHAACDALGMPIKFILTGGQTAECMVAIPLLEGIQTSALLADKGYDTNELRAWLKARGIEVVIPPKSNRKEIVTAIIGFIRSDMLSNACLASSSITVGLLLDMRKKLCVHGNAVFCVGIFVAAMKRQQNLAKKSVFDAKIK